MRRVALLLALGLVALTGWLVSAEAVDVVPPMAERSRQPARAVGRIAYVAAGQIHEWADGAARPLTRPGVRWEGVGWSPDGKSLTSAEIGENHSDVWVIDAAGNKVRQVTRHWSLVSVSDSAWGRRPAWSPSGETIAYGSDLYRTDMSLWLVNANGNNPRRAYSMVYGSGGLDWPSWSPDSKRVAFASYPAGPFRPPQIFVLTLATGAIVQLTELKDGAFDPAWSPDGTTIAFAGRASGKTNVMTMKVDGSSPTRLSDGRADRAPAWSPDGNEIAYLALNNSSFDVWVVRISGGAVSEPRQLTRAQNVDAVSGVAWTE